MTKWHFTRTPHYSGPDDPAIGQIRGTIALDETVVIETIGGADNDYEAAGFLKAGQIISGASHRRCASGLCHRLYGQLRYLPDRPDQSTPPHGQTLHAVDPSQRRSIRPAALRQSALTATRFLLLDSVIPVAPARRSFKWILKVQLQLIHRFHLEEGAPLVDQRAKIDAAKVRGLTLFKR